MGFWTRKSTTLTETGKQLATTSGGELAKVQEDTDIVVSRRSSGINIKFRTKPLKINGKTFEVSPKELIRMIKQVTQTIGEYKNRDNPYAGYVIGALRKARSDMVSDLEHHFKISWEIDEETNKSVFFYEGN